MLAATGVARWRPPAEPLGRSRQRTQEVYYAFKSGALLTLRALDADPARWLEVAVLVVAPAVGTVAGFVLFGTWMFARRRSRA